MPRKKTPKRKPRKSPRRRSREDVFDQRVEHFSKEVEALGEKFGRRVEKHGREFGDRMEKKGEAWDSWFHRTFGVVGPVISSIFAIIIFALGIWVLGLVNLPIGSAFLSNVSSFFTQNMGLFFLIFLFFSYASYFSRASPRCCSPISPIITAVGIIVGLWIAVNAINIANISLGIPVLSSAASYLGKSLFWIFWLVLFIGYLVFLIKTVSEKTPIAPYKPTRKEGVSMAAKKPKPGEIHRLYRSGKDKILGGVCGGIGEYLGVDPVIIRLLWVIASLAWGFGILAYIIAWIIIPRNPRYKWKD